MDILSNFSENFAELLNEKELTVEQFAESVGINFSEVYRYLRKEYMPKLSNVIRIADFFGCSIDGLLGLAPFSENAAYKKTPPFSERFKELLNNKHMTRYYVGKHTDISANRLDGWYHGQFTPSLDKALTLAKFFNCTLDYLFGRE